MLPSLWGFAGEFQINTLHLTQKQATPTSQKLIPFILQNFSGIACHLSYIIGEVLQRKIGLDVI